MWNQVTEDITYGILLAIGSLIFVFIIIFLIAFFYAIN